MPYSLKFNLNSKDLPEFIEDRDFRLTNNEFDKNIVCGAHSHATSYPGLAIHACNEREGQIRCNEWLVIVCINRGTNRDSGLGK